MAMETKTLILISIPPLCLLLLPTFIGFASIIILLLALHRNRINNDGTQHHPLPPGPLGYPIIGCLPQMIKNKPTFRWIHRLMEEMKTEIACFRIGNVHVIPIASPELAREFLKKQDAIFATRPCNMSARLVSNNFLTAGISPAGNQWKKMRRILTSEVLSPATHEWLHDERCQEANHLVMYVYNQCQNPETNGLVNLRSVTRHYCGNLMRKLLLGRRFFGRGMEDGGPGVEEREHVDALFTITSHLFGFGIADFVPWLEVFDFDGCKRTLCDAISIVRGYQDLEIDRRVETWEKGHRNANEDILDILINLKDSENKPLLSIDEIKAEILEMSLATLDSPSNLVEWTIAEMMVHPEMFEKAHEELGQVVGKDRLVQEADLSKLNYIKACARETFRLHPVAPFNLPHVATKDAIAGGYFIPKGSQVWLSRTGLGRNPRVWEDPLKYNPNRHIIDGRTDSEVTLMDPELELLSYSTGRRGCVGTVLGSTMTIMLLARLIHCFNWRAPPDGAQTVDLVESDDSLSMAKPLVAQATSRLEPHVYQQLY